MIELLPTDAEMVAWTHWQAGLWTAIDTLCVGLVLWMMDRLRRRSGIGAAWPRWILLAAATCYAPRLLGAVTRQEIVRVEMVVVSAHLGALLLAAGDLPLVLRLLRDLEARIPGR